MRRGAVPVDLGLRHELFRPRGVCPKLLAGRPLLEAAHASAHVSSVRSHRAT